MYIILRDYSTNIMTQCINGVINCNPCSFIISDFRLIHTNYKQITNVMYVMADLSCKGAQEQESVHYVESLFQ